MSSKNGGAISATGAPKDDYQCEQTATCSMYTTKINKMFVMERCPGASS